MEPRPPRRAECVGQSRYDDDSDQYNSTGPQSFNASVALRQTEARAAQLQAASHVTTVPRRQKWKRALLMACILTGFLFSLLDMTIVSTSLLATAEDLNGFSDSSWVVLAYLLTYMGFSVFFAKLSDIYGRRNILVTSWIIFVVSSVACGCSYNMTQLIVFRALQGIGGAGLYSLTTIALPEVGPGHRPEIIGKIIGFTLSVSFILGPILGGLIPEISTWRVIYWINAPFAIVTIVGLLLLYPCENRRRPGRSLARLDIAGSVLLLGSTILLVIALQEAGSLVVSWNSLLVVLSLVLSAVSFALFMGWQCWLSVGSWEIEPVFPLRLLRNRVYLACLLNKFLIGYVYLSLIVTVPQRFQIINDASSLTTGVHLLPMLGGTAVGCLATGPINAKKNRTAPVVVVSCILIVVGTSLLATVDSISYPPGPMYGFLALFGFGFGLFMSAATMMSTAQAPPGDHAVAQGAISQLRILGGILGLTSFTIVFNSHVQSADGMEQLTADQMNVLRRSPSTLIELWPNLKDVIEGIYNNAFHMMASITAGVAGLAVLVSLVTWEKNPPSIYRNLDCEKALATSHEPPSDIELDDTTSTRSLLTVHAAEIRPPAPAVCSPRGPLPAMIRRGRDM